MSYIKIRTETLLDGCGLQVVLNAPKANILDGAMMAELNALLEGLATRPELKLICFTGEGKHFSFGASVPEHVKERAPEMLEAFHGLFLRLIDLAIPTISAVRGQCLGGGMELATFCNWVVAHPEASFGQPETQLAVLPPVASIILPLKIGQSRADDVIVTGRAIPAEEGAAMGFVDWIDDDPMIAVEQWAIQEIQPKSAAALRCAVRAARWQFNQTVRSELKQIEKYYLETLMETHDANEGLLSFIEKRKPQWKNA